MKNKNKDQLPVFVVKTFRKVLLRSKQDLERGLRKPGLLFPAVQHKIEKDDFKGELLRMSMTNYIKSSEEK